MQHHPPEPDPGVQPPSSSVSSRTLHEPGSSPISVLVPRGGQQFRLIVWLLLWALGVPMMRALLGDASDSRALIGEGILGAIVGIVGSNFSEKLVVARRRRQIVLFLSLYWAFVWTLVPIIFVGAVYVLVALGLLVKGVDFAQVHLGYASGLFGALVLDVLYNAVKGAVVGAIGGLIITFRD